MPTELQLQTVRRYSSGLYRDAIMNEFNVLLPALVAHGYSLKLTFQQTPQPIVQGLFSRYHFTIAASAGRKLYILPKKIWAIVGIRSRIKPHRLPFLPPFATHCGKNFVSFCTNKKMWAFSL